MFRTSRRVPGPISRRTVPRWPRSPQFWPKKFVAISASSCIRLAATTGGGRVIACLARRPAAALAFGSLFAVSFIGGRVQPTDIEERPSPPSIPLPVTPMQDGQSGQHRSPMLGCGGNSAASVPAAAAGQQRSCPQGRCTSGAGVGFRYSAKSIVCICADYGVVLVES